MDKVSHVIEHRGLSIKVVIGKYKGIYKALSYVVFKNDIAINDQLSDRLIEHIEDILLDYTITMNREIN